MVTCRACKSFPSRLRFLFFIFLPSSYSNKVNFQSILFQLSSHLLVAVVSSFRANEQCFSCHSYFYLFFWRVPGFSTGFSHPYNNKTVCCQQVCSCHCCCIALLSVKHRVLIRTSKPSEKFATLNEMRCGFQAVVDVEITSTTYVGSRHTLPWNAILPVLQEEEKAV